MLNALDAVDWTRLHGAYGPVTDAPALIRAMAGPDAEAAAKARRLLAGAVCHQGTTYSASAPVVPFLAELLAAGATHHRAELARLLGELAAHGNQRTKHVAAVRAAVTAEADRLLPLLDDADPGVRDGVAFALSQCPKRKRDSAPALRARLGVETDPQTKARILAAVAWLEPASGLAAEALSADQPAPVRAAAALILARSDRPWSAAATEAVRAGWADGEPLERCWWWGTAASPLQDLVAALGKRGTDCAAVLVMLLQSSSAPIRQEAARASAWVVKVHRAARPLLVPVLATALADPSAEVGELAATALHEAGEAARPAAGALARSATVPAIRALVHLGDPRGPALVTAGNVLDVLSGVTGRPSGPFIAYDPAFGAALAATAPAESWGNSIRWLVAAWGPAADAVVPRLLAGDGLAPLVVQALAAIGPAAAGALPRLRTAADGAGPLTERSPFRVHHVEERLAILRIGGDPGPALDAARAALAKLHDRAPAEGYHHVPYDDAVALLDGLGEHARPLLPEIRALLTAHRDFLGLARAAWRLTGAADEVTPTVRRVLELAAGGLRQRTPQHRGDQAADLAAELGDPDLVPLLTPLLADPTPRCRVPAARAVWRLTGRADGLIAPLLKEVTPRPPGYRWAAAFTLLTEMGPAAAAALPELRGVAEHPWCPFVEDFERSPIGGLGHLDDAFLAAARTAVAAIEHGQ
ncbi:hypothetical protein [Dactylosporangium sp. CA-092794]|uniref:hypothetical protein n=1 Tax=Dactylosporangium sp. CA-092794 TaxID=3239929 RepID=UPI003D90E27B